jgi:hypothetical protein
MSCLRRRSLKAHVAVLSRTAKLVCALVLALCPALATAASYASAATTFNWVDASAHAKLGPSTGGAYSPSYQFTNPGSCGTNPPAIDDAISDNVPIGFSFTYGGVGFTQARVMSNGRLQFNDNAYCGYGSPVTQLAYPDGNLSYTMRIYGADLDPSLQAEVGTGYTTPCLSRDSCYVSYATLGVAPDRRFVVTWSNVPEWANFGEAVGNYNLQIILQENGDFIYQYGSHAPGPGSVPAQIGWEVAPADYAEAGVGYPAENSAIRFYAPIATPPAPGGFNVFESATAAGAITGVIHTKVAGAAFTVDVVALDAARTAVLTTFTGSVNVELLDGSDNSGALDAGGCRASWPLLPGSTPATIAFAGADNGRKAVTLSEANAWRDLRVRISAPSSGVATTVACSGDDFANRPASFAAFAASDADSASAGTTRALANATAAGGNVHQAGRPFTVHAAAVNAGGATTSNYVGTATPQLAACAGTACVGTAGTLTLTATAVAGVIDRGASYDETGSIALQLVDSSFAAVDAGDGSSAAERTIASPAIVVGRFVPDRFDLVALAAPTLRTFDGNACAARSFTYVGQPFGYAAVPQATVYARNAAGATTANYSGVLWKLAAATQAWAALPATPAFDASAATLPALTSNNNGRGLVAAQASDRLRFTRPTNAPAAPFDAAIALTWSVGDTSEAAVPGNPTIASAPLVFANMAFDAGSQFRYGVLRLVPAYGSELVDLPVLIEAQYWDGQRMATNAADQCTAVPTGALAMANYQRNLAACKTAVAPATATLASGRTYAKLTRPGSGNNGSVDLALQLGASASGQTCGAVGAAAGTAAAANLPWLQGRWGGAAAFDQNPSTRASFGQYRSPLIYLREVF